MAAARGRSRPDAGRPSPLINEAADDRDEHLQPGDRVLLIVENDLGFAEFLLDTAREQGFKGLVTSLGAAALTLAREYKPDAITLDIYLPDIDGWRVLRPPEERRRRRGTSRSASSPPTRRASGPGLRRAWRSSPSRSKTQGSLDGLLDELEGTSSTPGRANLLVVERRSGRARRAVRTSSRPTTCES